MSTNSNNTFDFPSLPPELRLEVYRYLFTAPRGESRGLYMASKTIKAEIEDKFLKLHVRQLAEVQREVSTASTEDNGNMTIDFTIPKTIKEAIHPQITIYVNWNHRRLSRKDIIDLLELRNIESIILKILPHPTDPGTYTFPVSYVLLRMTWDLDEAVTRALLEDHKVTALKYSPSTKSTVHANKITIDVTDGQSVYWELPNSTSWRTKQEARMGRETEGNKVTVWDKWAFGLGRDMKTLTWQRKGQYRM